MPNNVISALFAKPNTYINAEVMYVNNPNLITYNGNYVVLHNAAILDEKGNAIELVSDDIFGDFARAISEVESKTVDWKIMSPVLSSINDITSEKSFHEIVSRLDSELGKYGLNDSSIIADYCFKRLTETILPRVGIPDSLVEGVAHKIMKTDMSPTVIL